jgi:ribonuclease HI
MSKTFFYAVRMGRKPGVYATWDEAAEQVNGFPSAQHRKFLTREEANAFVSKKPKSVNLKNKSTSKKNSEVTKPMDLDPNMPRLYCDGSCPGNGSPSARAGYGVYVGRDSPHNLSKRVPSTCRQTNQTAELLAAINAVRIGQAIYPDGRDFAIITDSNYAVKCVNEWRRRWISVNWTCHLVNKDLLKELSDAVDAAKPRKILFKWIKGHAGHEGNEEADRLANEGAALEE